MKEYTQQQFEEVLSQFREDLGSGLGATGRTAKNSG